MYSILHKHKGITVAIIFLATVGFFIWLFLTGGITNTTSSQRCVVEVNSGCITLKDYRREMLKFSEFLKNQQMEQVVKEQVLSNLIAQELLYQKAKSLNIVASDEELIEVIKSDPVFHEGGVFSASKYKELLSRIGMTPEEYEDYLRKAISIQKLIRFLTNGVYITEKELEINLIVDSTLLSGKLYLITPSDVKDKYSPTEKDLLDYYQKNIETFKRPEVRVLWIWKEKDKEKALALYKDLKAGKEVKGFEEYRIPEDNPKLGETIKIEAQKLTLQDRISTFKDGENYVVLYLREILPPGYEDFERVKEKVREKLIEEKSQTLAKERAEEALKALREGKEPNLKSLNFSDTPAIQISAVIDIDQKDLIKMATSKEKVFGPYSLKQGYGILVIDARNRKNIEEGEKKEILRDLHSLKSQAILSKYVENLERKSKIKINRELIGGS